MNLLKKNLFKLILPKELCSRIKLAVIRKLEISKKTSKDEFKAYAHKLLFSSTKDK